MVLFSAHRLIFLPSSKKISQRISKLLNRHDCQGEQFSRNVDGVMVLVLCSSPDFVKISQGVWEFSCTISTLKFAKEYNSVKNVGGVMVLVFCMSFDDALYWYKV